LPRNFVAEFICFGESAFSVTGGRR